MGQPDELNKIAGLLKKDNLDRFLLRGALFSLVLDGSPEAVELLKTCSHTLQQENLSEVAAALSWLAHQGNQAAVDALYYHAIHAASPSAARMIQTFSYPASNLADRAVFALLYSDLQALREIDPSLVILSEVYQTRADSGLKERMRTAARRLGLTTWLLIVESLERGAEEDADRILNAFPAMNPAEQELTRNWLMKLAREQNQAAVSLLARLFIVQADPGAFTLMEELSALPQEDSLKAAVFFLAEKWSALDALDFDHRLIRSFYYSAAPSVQQRILRIARSSGRLDWMGERSSSRQIRWLTDMDDASLAEFIDRLIENHQPQEIQKIILHASLRQAVLTILQLNRAGILLEEFEQEEWRQQVQLAEACALNLPGLTVSKKGRLHVGPISTALQDPENTVLALCMDDGSAAVVHLPEMVEVRRFDAPSGSRYFAALPVQGEDAAALACIDGSIKIARLSDGRMLKSIQGHTGLVKGLGYEPQSRLLYTAGFDRSLRCWSFPEGLARGGVYADAEILSLTLSASSGIALTGSANGKISRWRTNDLTPLGDLPSNDPDAVLSLSTSKDGKIAVSMHRQGKISFWNPGSGRQLGMLTETRAVKSAALMPDGKTLYILRDDNRLDGVSVPGGQLLTSALIDKDRLQFLFSQVDQHLMALSVSGEYQILETAAVTFTLKPAGAVAQRIEGLPDCWKQLSDRINRQRLRFDIEIGDHTPVSSGEFDIFLEGV